MQWRWLAVIPASLAATCWSDDRPSLPDRPWLIGTAPRSVSDCADIHPRSERDRKSCIADSLAAVHEHLESAYGAFSTVVRTGNESAMMDTAQRDWTASRNRACGLKQSPETPSGWRQVSLKSVAQGQCIFERTWQRVETVRRIHLDSIALLVTPIVEPAVAPPAVEHAPAIERQDPTAGASTVRSARGHRYGRHYFEITIDETRAGDVKATATASATIGKQRHSIGHEIRRRDQVIPLAGGASVTIVGANLGDLSLPKTIVGVAVDLDSRQVFRHRDGNWIDGATPSGRNGKPLAATGEAFAEVSATTPLGPLIADGIVSVNFGDRPFSGNQPAGYRGFDWPDHMEQRRPLAPASMSTTRPFRPGKDQRDEWLRRYVEWIDSFDPANSPNTDPTGGRCSHGQAGDPWFLAGSADHSKIRRECAVPPGRSILVPVAYMIMRGPVDFACERLQVHLRRFSEGLSALRFAIDGRAMGTGEIVRATTACFTTINRSTGNPQLVAGSGAWVFVPPLEKGRYVFEFGARESTSQLIQDVSYVIHVR